MRLAAGYSWDSSKGGLTRSRYYYRRRPHYSGPGDGRPSCAHATRSSHSSAFDIHCEGIYPMTTVHRPHAVVFDVNETLIDLARLREVFGEFGLPPLSLQWWFSTLLRDGFALATTGDVAPFSTLAGVALEEVASSAGRRLPPDALATILTAFAQLPPHDDVAPALELLTAYGVPALTLTNGSAATTRDLLGLAGLSSLVDRCFSVAEVGQWKPRAQPYLYVASEMRIEPSRLAMVAVHPWDLHGASAAGLTTGWINREGRAYPPVFRRASVEETNLSEVVERLLQLPEG